MVSKCNGYSLLQKVKQFWFDKGQRKARDTATFCVPYKKGENETVYLILFSVKVFLKSRGKLAIKFEFTIQSEMRSRRGRGAKLFKTNVYLEK